MDALIQTGTESRGGFFKTLGVCLPFAEPQQCLSETFLRPDPMGRTLPPPLRQSRTEDRDRLLDASRVALQLT
jgi:hypothetical protein